MSKRILGEGMGCVGRKDYGNCSSKKLLRLPAHVNDSSSQSAHRSEGVGRPCYPPICRQSSIRKAATARKRSNGRFAHEVHRAGPAGLPNGISELRHSGATQMCGKASLTSQSGHRSEAVERPLCELSASRLPHPIPYQPPITKSPTSSSSHLSTSPAIAFGYIKCTFGPASSVKQSGSPVFWRTRRTA